MLCKIIVPTSKSNWLINQACVGDASFGEDPTVDELEREIATIFGKEVAS